MRQVIKHSHEPGRHCASTSLADLLRYHGIHWSEAMCFGIGGGLGIWYVSLPGMSPSRLLHVRSAHLERQFFQRIGMKFAWQTAEDPAKSEADLKKALAEGRPAILLTDLYYLPYYRSRTHFPGHCIAAWGYDEEEEVFYVSDTEREGVLPVPFEDMRKARIGVQLLNAHQGNFFAPDGIRVPAAMDEIIVAAIVDNARQLGESERPYQGLNALGRLSSELSQWAELDDWQWAARFMYQVVEKRGTGGGGFRLMYADFLKEAAAWVPRIDGMGLPALMLESARAWQDLAKTLKALSEQEKPDTMEVESALASVIRSERRYAAEALQLSS